MPKEQFLAIFRRLIVAQSKHNILIDGNRRDPGTRVPSGFDNIF